MGILFVLWSWYFDGISGGSEQPVRTPHDAVRLHIWSCAHFPLYLGIIVAGVGFRRIVMAASRTTLDPADALILTCAMGVVMIAMTVIGAASASRQQRESVRWLPHVGLAAGAVGVGTIGSISSPVAFIMAMAALCVAQLGVSLSTPMSMSARRRVTASMPPSSM